MRVRRLAATAIDGLLGFALAILLSLTKVGAFFAERAVVMLQIDDPTSAWKGPIPLVLGAFGEVSYTVPFAILVVVATEAVLDRSPGKWLVGLRIAVDDAGGGGGGGEGRARWERVAIKTIGLWGVVLGLVLGSWQLALACVIVGGALTLGAACAGFAPWRPPHERVSRTHLVRT